MNFDEFTIPLLDDFAGGDHDELLLLLCPIRALKKYLARTEQYLFGISGLFTSTSQRKKRVSQNTTSFGSDWSSTMSAPLLLKKIVAIFGSRCTKYGNSLLLFSSGGTAQFISSCVEGWNLVFSVYLFLFLITRCHPQAFGCLLRWAYGGGSAGCVTR